MADLARPLGHSRKFIDPMFSKFPARYAPWWRYVEYTLPAAAPAAFTWEMLDSTLNLIPGQGAVLNVPAIRNDQQWPVFVQEIRWMVIQLAVTPFIHFFGAKLSSDLQGQITGRHVLLGAYMVDDRAFLHNTGQTHAVFKLPERYQQSHKGVLTIKLLPTNASCAARQLDICLRGFDPINKTPIVLNKRHTTGIVGQETTVVFDDDRDGPVRDMWIDDICFGAVTMFRGAGGGLEPFDELLVRIEPNAGPRWTTAPWTPIRMLCEHVHDDIFTVGVDRMAIHRPMVPYPLNAGHALRVNMMTYVAWANTVRIRMIARGVQGVADVTTEVR